MNTKPAAQLSLESIVELNKAEADRLSQKAADLRAENERIEAEMNAILSRTVPISAPASAKPAASERIVAAYKNGTTLDRMTAENAATEPPAHSVVPLSSKSMAEREVVYAAVAIVRSWQRRHKKTYHNQEKELMNAVERLTWEP